MSYYVEAIAEPDTEPVTAAEVKAWARVSHSLEDTIIEGWIKSGRIEAQRIQRKAYITQQFRVVYDVFPCTPVRLPYPPFQQVDTIAYVDNEGTGTTLYSATAPVGTEDQFIIDSTTGWGRIALVEGYTWPGVTLREISGFTITYTAGYGDDGADVPQDVKDAITLYCSYRFNDRCGVSPIPDQFYNVLLAGRVFKGAGDVS